MIKHLLLCFFAPEYKERLPKKDPKDKQKFYARSYTESFTGRTTLQTEKVVVGKRAAYIQARWDALKTDWKFDHPELGIKWEVARTS